MMAETFQGIDLEWMRAQWRDCADKDVQLTIFKDMTGERKAVILHALGMDRIEKGLLEELSAVRAARDVYRRELTALLEMAGGALGGSEAGDAEP